MITRARAVIAHGDGTGLVPHLSLIELLVEVAVVTPQIVGGEFECVLESGSLHEAKSNHSVMIRR